MRLIEKELRRVSPGERRPGVSTTESAHQEPTTGGGVMPAVIEIEGLRKEFRRRGGRAVAVDGLNLSVPEGGVFGFLGPNGSGKTTTIRCLLGLVRSTAGSVRLFGRPVPAGLPDTLRRVGAIIETPAMFPTMTGRENLRLLARLGGIGNRRVDDVLGSVGLAERAGHLVRTYSLGMRQRLGLAAALLKDPALLVLDEPANGLDPAGIREVRELLRRLGAEGRTVFVSSHVLSEVALTCDAVAILNRGRCVAQGTVAEVLASSGPDELFVKTDDLHAAHELLRQAGFGVRRENGHLRVWSDAIEPGLVTKTLAGQGLWVTEMRPAERTLEELFLEVTGEPAAPVSAPRPADPISTEVLA
jgi:ABC-2 type transport system ATP-binding protein